MYRVFCPVTKHIMYVRLVKFKEEVFPGFPKTDKVTKSITMSPQAEYMPIDIDEKEKSGSKYQSEESSTAVTEINESEIVELGTTNLEHIPLQVESTPQNETSASYCALRRTTRNLNAAASAAERLNKGTSSDEPTLLKQ